MGIISINTQFEKGVATSMKNKLRKNEEVVLIEKEKSKNCRSAIRKNIDSLCELLNGEELSEENTVETSEPVLSLGGPDDESK